VTSPRLQTRSGQAYDLLNPDPSTIILDDVAHALAHLARYTGHASGLYTVAQHSVLGARVLRHEGHSDGVQRAFLLHDAHECVTGDVASPIKRAIAVLFEETIFAAVPRKRWMIEPSDPWTRFEERHRCAFARRFSAPRDLPKSVKDMDLRMLMTEARDLMVDPPQPWGVPADPIEPSTLRITRCWSPREAKGEFLEECGRLGVV